MRVANGTDRTVLDGYQQRMISGGALLRQNRVADAQAEFKVALEQKPDDKKALGLLGLTYFRMNEFRDALPVYEKLVVLSPNDAALRLNLGLVKLKLGDTPGAIIELVASRELDPGQKNTVNYLGLAYARDGQYGLAYQAFIRAGEDALVEEMASHLSIDECKRLREEVEAGMRGEAPPEPEPEPEPEAEAEAKTEAEPDAAAEAEPEAEGGVVVIEAQSEASAAAEAAQVDGIVSAVSRSEVSQAVKLVRPSAGAEADISTVPGHVAPRPLSEFATSRLIRPEDGHFALEIAAGGVLVIKVDGRIMSRTEGVIVSHTGLSYEPATRRVRGRPTEESLGSDGRKIFIIGGKGHMVASPLGEEFTAVILDDDILYLRETLVFAFEEQLRWENGRVPGASPPIPMIQFRGDGCVAFRTKKPLLSVKLGPDRVLYVDSATLVGWVGRVIPRMAAPAAGGDSSTTFVECTGEGVILLEDIDSEQSDTP